MRACLLDCIIVVAVLVGWWCMQVVSEYMSSTGVVKLDVFTTFKACNVTEGHVARTAHVLVMLDH